MIFGLCDYGLNGVYWGLVEEFNVVIDVVVECEVYVEFVNVIKFDFDLYLFYFYCCDYCDFFYGYVVFVSSI